MQEKDETRRVGRRRLLRRAGTVAAGAAGASVVGALAANPAQADDGESVKIGVANTGTGTTTLTSGDAANPTLRLANSATAGPALSVQPTTTQPSLTAPAGSIYIDGWGDLSGIGTDPDTDEKFLAMTYSPTWASMVVPRKRPVRWVDTRDPAQRVHLLPGSNFDSSGRLLAKGSNTIPDAIIDLSELFFGGYGAVQANLTVANATGNGHAALWADGNYPGTSSINFSPTMPAVANFTQTFIADDLTIRLKVNMAVRVVLDILGFVVADPFSQLAGEPSARSAGGARQKRVPPGN